MTQVWTGDEMAGEQARRKGNEQRVLEALRAAGPAGVTNYDLVAIGGLRAVGGRVDALRHKGYDVESIRERGGVWRYRLHEPARPKRPQPGEAGYLSSLPVVGSIYDNNRPRTTDDESGSEPGCLF